MRKIIKYLIITLLIVNIKGCVIGSPKSDYKMKLVQNYELWKVNNNRIVIGTTDGDGVLDSNIKGKVIELDYNDEYIIARSIPTYKADEKDFSNLQEKDKYIESIPEKDYEFWIIAVENNIGYGPFNEENFNKKRNEILVPKSMALEKLENYEKHFEYVE